MGAAWSEVKEPLYSFLAFVYNFSHIVEIKKFDPLRHASRCSIVVSIPACHAGDPGSIPGNGASRFFHLNIHA